MKKIGEMYFGATDANNEIRKIGEDGLRDLFQLAPGLDVESVLEGDVTYIRGDKGTGKTMILRYIEMVAKQRSCPSRFIRYRRDFAENDLKAMRQSANNISREEYVADQLSNSEAKDTNYILGWQVYLIKEIVELVNSTESKLFDRSSHEWRNLNKILNEAYASQSQSLVKQILPKMKKGRLSLNAKHLELDLEFSSNNEDGLNISFSEFAKYVIDLYSKVPRLNDTCPMYLFIDEIELHYGKDKEYKRDLRLVGDLVMASNYLNDISRELSSPVYIIIALRNEIFRSSVNLGCELNKPIEDYGIQIKWGNPNDWDNNPLLEMIERRVLRNLDNSDPRNDDVWGSVFPNEVDGIPIKEYILKQTWQKPRDIIRLLMILRSNNQMQYAFSERSFFDIRRDYSEKAWREIKEELTAVVQNETIEALSKVLNGMISPFRIEDLTEKINQDAENYSVVEKLAELYKTPELISLLFKFEIIGNISSNSKSSGRARFSAYGEDEPDLSGLFVVHYPLRSAFDIRVRHSAESFLIK